jgi:hypothetical protein
VWWWLVTLSLSFFDRVRLWLSLFLCGAHTARSVVSCDRWAQWTTCGTWSIVWGRRTAPRTCAPSRSSHHYCHWLSTRASIVLLSSCTSTLSLSLYLSLVTNTYHTYPSPLFHFLGDMWIVSSFFINNAKCNAVQTIHTLSLIYTHTH